MHGPRIEREQGVFRAVGLGLITGAADDDPSAIGTYATAGAKLGPSFLWTAPVTLPMMFAVVYLSSKLGQVSGKGLFDVIRERYPRSILNVTLAGMLIGNTIEAAADLARYIAAKGSVALDGISLTVNEVEKGSFGVNIVPHTLTHTTLGAKKPGDRVNLEVDVFARYVARAMESKS
jgi:hypothetical protein